METQSSDSQTAGNQMKDPQSELFDPEAFQVMPPGKVMVGMEAVRDLLLAIGEDPSRDGLKDTPKRVVKAMMEMTSGYRSDPKKILARVFDADCDEMIVLRKIPFVSMCEHHMLPFTGYATVGYIPKPKGGVVGISKLARLVDCFARRLQIQEVMTQQIASAIQENLDPIGVGVTVKAVHSCMSCRGVLKTSEMITSALIGAMRENASARAEFFSLAE